MEKSIAQNCSTQINKLFIGDLGKIFTPEMMLSLQAGIAESQGGIHQEQHEPALSGTSSIRSIIY